MLFSQTNASTNTNTSSQSGSGSGLGGSNSNNGRDPKKSNNKPGHHRLPSYDELRDGSFEDYCKKCEDIINKK